VTISGYDGSLSVRGLLSAARTLFAGFGCFVLSAWFHCWPLSPRVREGRIVGSKLHMLFENPGERSVPRQVARLAAVAMLTCAPEWANPQSQPSEGSGRDSAVWASRELNFAYQGFTTQYSCDGLQERMRDVLLKLGARPDLRVRGYGCTRLAGPDPLAGVSIEMHVLQPAGKRGGPAVPVHWQRVDLLTGLYELDPVDAAADCELIGQIKQQILPLFATRNVEYSATCEQHHLLVGATRLKAEVLVADQGAAGAGAATGDASALSR
jgi:hypothetical protein